MKENQGNIRLTTIHFCFLFILLLGVIYIKVWIDNRAENTFDAVDKIQVFTDSAPSGFPAEGLCFVLFYDKEDSFAVQIEESLYRLSENEGKEAIYYKVNGPAHEQICMDYDIAGFPSILILKDGIEINRIWGTASYFTLKHIYKKVYDETHIAFYKNK